MTAGGLERRRRRLALGAAVIALLAAPWAPARGADGDPPAAPAAETASAPATPETTAPPPVTALDLRKDALRAGGITIGALLLDRTLTIKFKTTACRICGSNGLDEAVRDALVWSDTAAAGRASDVLAKGVLPVLAGVDAWRSTGTWSGTGRDLLVVAEAVAISNLATEVAKLGFARRRPGQPETGAGGSAYHSLWSGHAALAFTLVTAQATQDTLRDDPAAPWVWGIGLTLATAVGYLRVGADQHWLTDVLAGAAAGSLVGVGVPVLEHRLVKGVTIVPAPGGLAVLF